MSYTNHGELSNSTCCVRVDIDMTRFGNNIDADRIMSDILLAAKESVDDFLNGLASGVAKNNSESNFDFSQINLASPIEKTETSPKKDDTGFNFRDRLPNNVVDINELTVKQAVTENSLVRCPKCGQAHCIAINSGDYIYVMARDYGTNEYRIIAEFDSLNNQNFIDMCRKEDGNYLSYFDAIREVNFKNDSDFAVDNDTEIFCPVCHMTDSFLHWKDAYEHPLKYFETENICDACGGERVEKFIGKRKCQCCEKCGLPMPIKEE